MKKYIIFIASAVLMMTACVKEEINTTITGETEFISVELNAATKTQLSGTNTSWTSGDQVSVTVDGKNLGSLTLVEGNVFAGEIESVGLDGKLSAIINYPADVTTVPTEQKAVAGSFAEEASLLEGETTLAELRKGNGAQLANKTALLQFTVAQAGDVTFEVGTKKYTVTGCQTGSTYYACVEPATTGVNLSYTIGENMGVKSKKGAKFTAGSIYNLGELHALSGDWNLVGAIGSIAMEKSTTYTDLYVAKNVSLSSAKSFRFVNKDNTKTVGAYGASGTVDCKGQINSWYDSNATSAYAANISISTNANYDIYFSPTDLNFLIIKTGVETYNSQWEIVGWIANKDSWGGGSGYFLQSNYVNPALPLQITMDLTSGDYFKILKNKNWTAGNNGGWIGAPGNDGATKDYTLAVNGSTTVSTFHSYDNHKAQFHMKNNGTYKIEVTVGNVYASATVKLTKIK